MRRLLYLYTFKNKIYIQNEGVATGSPIGSAFMQIMLLW